MLSILLMDAGGPHSAHVMGMLQGRGHRVRHAKDPLGALAQARQTGPDVALLDWHWPAQEMLSLVESLAAAATTRHTRIMCTVSTPGAPEHYAALDRGADDIVASPVQEHDLLLRCAAAGRRRRDDRRSMIEGTDPLLTMCAGCNKVRDHDECWIRVEAHLARHHGVEVSHGYCPPCAERAFESITR